MATAMATTMDQEAPAYQARWKAGLRDLFGGRARAPSGGTGLHWGWGGGDDGPRRNSEPIGLDSPGRREATRRDGRRRRSTMEAPRRRPSIPAAVSNSDQSHDEMSALTLMTYSDERADALMREFLRRVRQLPRKLSEREQAELLMEIQREQEYQCVRARRTKKTTSQTGTLDLSGRTGTTSLAERKALMLDNVDWVDSDEMHEGIEERIRDYHGRRRDSMCPPLTTAATPELHASDAALNFDVASAGVEGTEEEEKKSDEEKESEEEHLMRANIVRYHARSAREAEGAADPTSHLSELIELKLLTANQQTAIDTLSFRIHNLELENRRLLNDSDSKLARAVKTLEDEKVRLTEQLRECREREASLTGELEARQRSVEKHRSSRRSSRSVMELDEVEARNEELERENARLRREVKALQGTIAGGWEGPGVAGADRAGPKTI